MAQRIEQARRFLMLRRYLPVLLSLACLWVGGLALGDRIMDSLLDRMVLVVESDAALVLLLGGASLLARSLGRLRLCRLASGLLLAVTASLAAGLIPLDTVHARPGTALPLYLLATLVAISLLASSWERGRLVARIGAALLGLSGVSLLAYLLLGLLGRPLTLGLFTHYQSAPALGLLLLMTGGALWLLERPSVVRLMPSLERPLAIGVIGVLLASGGWYWSSHQNLERMIDRGRQAVDESRSLIEERLTLHARLMARQASRWEGIDALPDHPLWQVESGSYLRDFPSLTLISLLGADYRPQRLATSHPEAAEWLAAALSQPQVRGWLDVPLHRSGDHLGPAITTDEGHPWLLIATPVEISHAPPHWLVAGLALPDLLSEAAWPQYGLKLSLHKGQRVRLTWPETADPHGWRPLVEGWLEFPHIAPWHITSHVPMGTLIRLTLLPSLLLLGGLAFTLLLMTSTALYQRGEQRRRALLSQHRTLNEVLEQRDQFFTLSLDLICRVDLAGRFLTVNAAFETLLGHREADLLGHPYTTLVDDGDSPVIEAALKQLAGGGIVRNLVVRVRTAGAALRWVEINAALGRERAVYVVARDITTRRESEHQLRLLESSVASSINGVVICDATQPDLPIVYVNPAFETITGYRREEVEGHNCLLLQGRDTDPRARQRLAAAIGRQEDVHVVIQNYRRDGSTFWNDLYISPVRDQDGAVTHFIGVQNDISAQKEYESQLAHHASHDALTGLPNRTLLEDRLQQGCTIARRHQRYLAVLFVDLDGFKPINDTLGHETGDHLLCEVARRLEAQLRAGDTVARFGGDEFVVVLTDLAHEDDVLPVVERLLSNLSAPYSVLGHELRITASIGISISDGSVEHPMRLIQQADLAMYKAKRQGRNTFHWFTHDLGHKVSERVNLRNALQRAIEEEQFELHYQPQIHAPSGRVTGVEALIRWKHPERGYISPLQFIGLAEDTGQIVLISDWVLRTACRAAAEINEMGLGALCMAVNVSPMQFQRPGFVAGVIEVLEESGLTPPLLELELTEGVLMDSTERVIETLQTLRDHGIRIAIDDFGTGFSSLSYLKHLPISKIKVDRSFVREVISDHRDAAIIEGVVAMAGKLRLDVTIEGVETQAQYAYLRKHLCDTFQGYLFARPMPMDELLDYLRHYPHADTLARESHQAGQEPQTLLLLDDEPNILRALARALRPAGYRILTATHAQEAFELLAREEVQVIISDQRMPEMSGTEFLRHVTELYPDATQIVLSGYTDLRTVTEAINEGAIYKFLTKPWDDDELRLVVNQAFRQTATRRLKRGE
ncbi:EAL domain-containing protein [Halomonas mongoliensis]|uniref:EAL domain-containing protein n=1 Tax=Halomonas mongoliensis TaxID=321265 RepID=UPI00403B33FD